jgi:hypothetical protein
MVKVMHRVYTLGMVDSNPDYLLQSLGELLENDRAYMDR